MTRTSIGLVAAAGLCIAFGAQAQRVQVYGLLDMAAGSFHNAGAAKTWRADSGGMSTSYLGVGGSEDLGGGLRARYAIEHFLRLDNGLAGRVDGDPFW
ncbi:MAG TPA: porin, partial [Albitalea sp.]|nr:porin [Albitalea sp.]